MFGHQDEDQNNSGSSQATVAEPQASDTGTPTQSSDTSPATPVADTEGTGTTTPVTYDNPASDSNPVSDDNSSYLDHLASDTLGDDTATSSVTASDGGDDTNGQADSTAPSNDTQAPSDNTTSDNYSGDDAASQPALGDDLLDIKKQALGELSPLVGHLEQSAEEKFKTTMMMIQANDNQSLIPDAYKAAKEISDDKARAQALLDIVNEINYFTHKN